MEILLVHPFYSWGYRVLIFISGETEAPQIRLLAPVRSELGEAILTSAHSFTVAAWL